MSPALLALVLAAAPAAETTSTFDQVAWDRAAAAAKSAVARAKLPEYGSDTLAEKARAAGLGRVEVSRLLGDLLAACAGATCPQLAREPAARRLVDTLGEIGTVADAPLLLRIEAAGMWSGDDAVETILTRAMADAIPQARCAPPSAAEVAAARASLTDFAVLRLRGGVVRGEAPTAVELDDLAYFFAAVEGAGPEVGAGPEASPGNPLRPGAPDPERDRLAGAMKEHRARGDVAALARDGRAYLARLGFPGPLDGAAEDVWAWGGARYSYVFRDLALAAELQGDPGLASQLYRRADPGGGMCGTSVSYRWAAQVRGAIRSAERSGDCRPALAERLLDVDGVPDVWSTPTPNPLDYGPARLADAGFDVARLYRGALLTAGRDAEPARVREALARAPEPLRAAALARLARRGPEAWDRRVYAIEGLADTAGRAALPVLVGMLPALEPAARRRALAAIGLLAERPGSDPCDPELGGLSLRGGSVWEREIRSLGRDCATSLRVREAGPLAMSLTPWLKDHDPETREAAATALGRIGHRAALSALSALRRDPFQPENVQRCDAGECRRFYPVREAVQEAIASIRERSADDPRWRRNDPPR